MCNIRKTGLNNIKGEVRKERGINMNNKATKLATLLLLMAMLFTGCTEVETTSGNEGANKEEFEVISEDKLHNDIRLTVVHHKETGKRFVIYSDHKRGGIAPMD